MKPDDKKLAESILRYLCVGRRVCGVNFYNVPILVIDTTEIRGSEFDTYLTIECEWRVFEEVPAELPIILFPGDIVNRQRTAELICAIGKLGWNSIVDVQLGDPVPHLLIKFENGQTLFLNGHHDKYESWNLSAGEFLVVATPGDEIAIWHPQDFVAGQ
jgi:hypothetical protein